MKTYLELCKSLLIDPDLVSHVAVYRFEFQLNALKLTSG